MMFDMDEFAQDPNLDKLDRCRKADLLVCTNLNPLDQNVFGKTAGGEGNSCKNKVLDS